MKIKDILQRDPATHPLVNQGQARIADDVGNALKELQGELSTFVCEGQYADGVQRILRSFLDNVGRTSQRAAWVSGFFGSGKSHLLKMLCHLWNDTRFPDGSTARSLVPSMPDELHALLRELDTAGKRAGGLVAAAGSLPSGTTEKVKLTILSVLLRAAGLPAQYPQARFCLWLKDNGHYDTIKARIEDEGHEFGKELNNLYVSGRLARALLACDPTFATDEAHAKQQLKAQFPSQPGDITTEQFLTTAKEALQSVGKDGRMPCTLLVLDEAQQYIGDSIDRSVAVTEIAEAVSKQLDSQVIMVCAGQSALTSVQLLHKLMDRFTIRIPLSDADVETVTRKVLLQKKPSAIPDVKATLEKYAGEVSRQLQGTHIGATGDDQRHIVDDFPLLPVRRRFWELCFRQVDAAGTQSQLRSQLRVIHDAVAALSDDPMTAVVPADGLYDALAPEMINTGVLLREISERIIRVGVDEGPLARRICGLVFLIGKLKRDEGADTGVRANKDHIADLLVTDLAADNGKLRSDVAEMLERLASQGTLMRVGDEYRMQTREGSEWDREFRNQQSRLVGDGSAAQFLQEQQLYAEVQRVVGEERPKQGAAKEPRRLQIYREETPPAVDGTTIPVWVRDEWSCSHKEVKEAARRAGTDDPVIYVFIAKQSAADLQRVVIEAEAARRTLDGKGTPSTDEGRDARSGMESRLHRAEDTRNHLVHEIVAAAAVYQGGGNELLSATLPEKLHAAAEDALERLFPRFKDADSASWGTAVKHARDGADKPFEPVGWTGAIDKHPVCAQVLASIGAGKRGTELRKELGASPYGWPQDAIDAALIALHRAQFLAVTLNGTAVAAGGLDQNKIPKAEFQVERVTLSIKDRLALRKLYQQAGISCKSGEEAAKAQDFLAALVRLARAAGGEAPLPAPSSTTSLEDLQRLAGNEQLAAIRDQAADLANDITVWTELADRAKARQPAWETATALAAHATALPAAKPVTAQLDAIRHQRLLLEVTDPVAPLQQQLAALLRQAVSDAVRTHEKTYADALAMLQANPAWGKLAPADQTAILADAGLVAPAKADVSSDEKLAAALDRRGLPEMRAETDAITGRIQRAIEQAARKLEPKVQPVALERATLHNTEELEAWIERQRKQIAASLKHGPVLLG